MSAAPEVRGRTLAGLHGMLAPRLFEQLDEAALLPSGGAARAQAWAEWECFALYACVRGLVAAGGFNRESATAIDAMHEAVLERWMAEEADGAAFATRRARVAERYAEYGAIGQAGGAGGAATVTLRLGEAAARHMTEPTAPDAGLVEMVGALHEALVEGATESARAVEN